MVYIGVDLGGTNIAIGIVNEQFEIIKKGSTPTLPERGGDAIIEDMAALSKKLLAECGLTLDDVAYAGVATPGTANSETGVVEYSNNIPFLHFPMAEKLSKLLDGKVYSGFNFAGAELGHTVIEKGGRPCTCGRKGCWEAYSSATGLVNITKDRILDARAAGRKTVMEDMIGGDLSKVSARTAFNAMKQGDEVGAEVVDEYITYLAVGVANIINIFQPNVLSIGGGVCNEGENLTKPLLEKVWKETYSREGTPKTDIRIAKLGNDAGIIGAAVLAQ